MSSPQVNWDDTPKTTPSVKWDDEAPSAASPIAPPAIQKPSVKMQSVGLLTGKPAVIQDPDAPLPGFTEGRGLREGLAEYDKASFGSMGKGAADLAHGKIARGGHEIISGGMNALTPAAPFLIPAAPVAAAAGTVGGAGGGFLARKGAEALGANEDQADLAEDIGGLGGGYLGAKVATSPRLYLAPIRYGARATEAVVNSKLNPLAKIMTPADDALKMRIRIPGRDLGLSKIARPTPAAPELTTEARTLPGQIPPERISPEPKAEIIPPVRRGLALPERTPSTIEAAVKSPSRTLPGQVAPETVQPEVLPGPAGARPSLHRITPSRGLALPPVPGGEPPVEASPTAPRSPSQTAMAFRARSAGEQGIPHNPASPAQATMSQPEAEGFLGGREDVTGEPQELVGVDLGEAPGFSTRPGPSGNDWVKFHGDVPESAIQPISAAKPSAETSSAPLEQTLDRQLDNALGNDEAQQGLEKQFLERVRNEPNVPLRQQISKIGKPSAPIKTAPLTNLSDQIKESAPPSQAPTMAPLGDLGAEIKSSSIELPEGFTRVEGSSVLAGYKYNPEAREFEAITNRGDHYVHSDVSPEEAAKFEAADSKGSAWNQLKKGPGVTLTKSGPVGKLEPVKPGTLKTSKGVIAKSKAGMNPDADPNAELTPKLKASVKKVEAEKRARARAQ